MFDLVPDIHGQFEKLTTALGALGYRKRKGAWRHSDPKRQAVFLGDFIDRGTRNADVIALVRGMVDAGTAQAIMGNHELNAIRFHTIGPTGQALRARTTNTRVQHASFLREFPEDAAHTMDAIGWMRSLPLFLDLGGFRAVHACWDRTSVEAIQACAPTGVLTEDQHIATALEDDPVARAVSVTTKGPEARLPKDHFFVDKSGKRRRTIRLKWWKSPGDSWQDLALSVPDIAALPPGSVPPQNRTLPYADNEKPVVFGHYWLSGPPVLQARNALCLDYSAGLDGPLVTCSLPRGATTLEPARIRVHDNTTRR